MSNHPNYQQQMNTLLEQNSSLGVRPRLLLHSCCAPCSSYVLEYLSRYFSITVLFYNPNLHPPSEYKIRADEQIHLIQALNQQITDETHRIKYKIEVFDPDEFYREVKGLEQEQEGGSRCEACFRLRLSYTAQYAKEHGFDYFTTTLSISPLKNSALLNQLGEQLAEVYGVEHLPADFKKKGGYQRSVELSKLYDLYRQDYCGCVYSATRNQ